MGMYTQITYGILSYIAIVVGVFAFAYGVVYAILTIADRMDHEDK